VKSVSKHNSVALLGGTFDPVHIGHLRIAVRLRELGFERVVMIPNNVPPHREQPIASGAARLAMLNLAIADLNSDLGSNLGGIETSEIELQRAEPSYSAATVETLHRLWPQACLTWVMGNDAWNGFDRWHQPERLLKHANVLVVSRPGDSARSDGWLGEITQKNAGNTDTLLSSSGGKICHLHWPELDISASDLRRAIKQGDNIVFLTPPQVQKYIKQHQLYR
jgi:nicotinate-nucleotide adenylyltransferase